jgi:RND family efflux transporter MFP subunit
MIPARSAPAVLALLLLPALPGCAPRGSVADAPDRTAAAAAIPISVAPVEFRALRRAIEVVGTLEPWEEITISAKVDGRVGRLLRDTGDRVRGGDLLLELDPTDLGLAADQAERAFESELAKLGLKQLPLEDLELDKIPTVVKALEQMQYADQRAARAADLYERKAISQDSLEQVQSEFRVARAAHEAAILTARATLASALERKAELASARQRLTDARIVAPTLVLDGQPVEYSVAERWMAVGELARQGTRLFSLIVDTPLKLKAKVPERHASEVRVGQTAEVEVESFPGKIFPGTVTRISPIVNTTNRTFEVEATLPNEGRLIKPGSFARGAIVVRHDPQVATVPQDALVRFAGVTKIFVVEQGKARALAVITGQVCGDRVEIVGGLPDDAQVVTSGQTRLIDGSPVRTRAESQRGSETAAAAAPSAGTLDEPADPPAASRADLPALPAKQDAIRDEAGSKPEGETNNAPALRHPAGLLATG